LKARGVSVNSSGMYHVLHLIYFYDLSTKSLDHSLYMQPPEHGASHWEGTNEPPPPARRGGGSRAGGAGVQDAAPDTKASA
jgi:hypothetical protein